ncbi:cysteine-rich CWC family protein [Clostridium omnivorum]|uniref:cysteine-rich CWC family protein n=1 Tax=Clostridium omnivorum TaxID=1604902 RepID=UPI002231BB6A|nr:cysteine-rich CWC family protein [Clostridium sp. E14]
MGKLQFKELCLSIEYDIIFTRLRDNLIRGVILVGVTGEERICPICGKDNNCQHGQGGCWCDNIKVPKQVLDLVPEDKKGKACICKACIEKYS